MTAPPELPKNQLRPRRVDRPRSTLGKPWSCSPTVEVASRELAASCAARRRGRAATAAGLSTAVANSSDPTSRVATALDRDTAAATDSGCAGREGAVAELEPSGSRTAFNSTCEAWPESMAVLLASASPTESTAGGGAAVGAEAGGAATAGSGVATTGGGVTGGAAAAGGGGAASGTGAGGAAGAGGGLVAARGGSKDSGSTYVSSSPTRTPRWTYGIACSSSPVGPDSARASPSPTRPPRFTSNVPRWVSDALYPSFVAIVTVKPWVGTCPANVIAPVIGANTRRASPRAMSTPRCCPPA